MEEILKEILEVQNQILKNLQQHGERLESLEKGQTRLETRMENEVIDKIRGLTDAREVTSDNLAKVNSTLGNLVARVEDLKEEVLLNRRETNDKLDSLDSSVIYLANKFTQHDMQLFDMKRRAK